jgi:S1-C subfamily serine protease
VNGEEVKDLRGYTGILKKYRPGDKAQFTILRNGKEIKVNLVFDER